MFKNVFCMFVEFLWHIVQSQNVNRYVRLCNKAVIDVVMIYYTNIITLLREYVLDYELCIDPATHLSVRQGLIFRAYRHGRALKSEIRA